MTRCPVRRATRAGVLPWWVPLLPWWVPASPAAGRCPRVGRSVWTAWLRPPSLRQRPTVEPGEERLPLLRAEAHAGVGRRHGAAEQSSANDLLPGHHVVVRVQRPGPVRRAGVAAGAALLE